MSSKLEIARAAAQQHLARFLDPMLVPYRPRLVESMRPRPDDAARVFVAEVADAARAAYAQLWESTPDVSPKANQVALEVMVASSEEFGTVSPRAQRFPGGYAEIARFLVAGLPWIAWRYSSASDMGGLAFNGLVYLDDHFAWFPKPWRVLPGRATTSGMT